MQHKDWTTEQWHNILCSNDFPGGQLAWLTKAIKSLKDSASVIVWASFVGGLGQFTAYWKNMVNGEHYEVS